MAVRKSSLRMNVPGGVGTSPGANLKPMFDGTFKEAGAHLETYVLEHENGSVAKVDTKTATCVSWKTADGKEQIKEGAGTAHFINGAAIDTEFVPEERAKKMTFDRMIFKSFPTLPGCEGLEYRVDVTMREDSLEYDLTIKNSSPNKIPVDIEVNPHLVTQTIVRTKGLIKETDGVTAKSGTWEVPTGKFTETEGFFSTK
jgi:hypothetical protein